MSVHASGLFKFEGYEVDRAQWQLRHGDHILPLHRKTFDVMLYLMEHADRVVSKDELLRVLWPEQFIEESNLTQQIFLLRKALVRHTSGKKIIETISGRGYRFAAPISFEPRPEPQEQVWRSSEISEGLHGAQAAKDQKEIKGVKLPGRAGQNVRTSEERLENHPSGDRTAVFSNQTFLWTVGTLTVGLLIALFLSRSKAPAHISISTYTQVTHDGHAKTIGGTDGSRIYFTRLERSAIAQVSISGKQEALMQVALQDPWSGAVSPDGSTLLIISQASGQGPAATLWALQLVDGSLHRLGNAVSSAWSPGGDEVVYASASGELFVMRYNGLDAHRIASVGGDLSSITWSPDGRTIRFSRDGLLWQISPNGSNLHQVFPGWGKAPTQWSGEWSPSGTYFFVADGQIWTLDGTSLLGRHAPEPVQLTRGPTVWDRPISSRDGKEIFASGRTRRGELVHFDPTSSQTETFLAGISAEFVTFSKAANAVAYVSYPDGVLWRANIDGSNPTQLTESPTYPKSIRWSPDGTQIAFADRTAESASTIFVVASDGKAKPRRLVASDDATETDPSWSPDGRKVVFSTAANVGASAKAELRIFDLATAESTVLPGSDGLLAPRWSPDGRAIAAMTLDTRSLKILNLSTGRWSSLDTGAVAFPEWSHDGAWIYYVRWTTNPAILRIRVEDGRQELFTDLKGARYTGVYTLWMGLDPSDRPMMLRDAGTDDIYALTLQRQ